MDPLLLDLPDHIETTRLIIRPPRAGDGAAVYEATVETLADLRAWPASMPWAMHEPSVEESEAFCRRGQANFILRTDLPLLLFLKADGSLAGSSGLHRMDWSVPRFEVGYWCRKRCQKQGLMTEAVRAIADFAFTHLGARRLDCLPDAENLASRRTAELSGFALESICRHERKAPDGGLRDACIYAMVR
jgi:RimJ/RimL family protein N-acetyltransferase